MTCRYSATRGIHVELVEDKDLIFNHHTFDDKQVESRIHTNEDLGTNQFIFYNPEIFICVFMIQQDINLILGPNRFEYADVA